MQEVPLISRIKLYDLGYEQAFLFEVPHSAMSGEAQAVAGSLSIWK